MDANFYNFTRYFRTQSQITAPDAVRGHPGAHNHDGIGERRLLGGSGLPDSEDRYARRQKTATDGVCDGCRSVR